MRIQSTKITEQPDRVVVEMLIADDPHPDKADETILTSILVPHEGFPRLVDVQLEALERARHLIDEEIHRRREIAHRR